MSVFSELLSIKEFRESQAETEVRRRRALLEEAIRLVDELRRKLEEFRIWSVRKEDEMFDDICRRIVKLREIEALRNRISELRNEERNLEQGVIDAEEGQRRASAELDAAVNLLREAGRQKNKFMELARVFSEEARLELERAEEAELEEFRTRDRNDEEWGDNEYADDAAVA